MGRPGSVAVRAATFHARSTPSWGLPLTPAVESTRSVAAMRRAAHLCAASTGRLTRRRAKQGAAVIQRVEAHAAEARERGHHARRSAPNLKGASPDARASCVETMAAAATVEPALNVSCASMASVRRAAKTVATPMRWAATARELTVAQLGNRAALRCSNAIAPRWGRSAARWAVKIPRYWWHHTLMATWGVTPRPRLRLYGCAAWSYCGYGGAREQA